MFLGLCLLYWLLCFNCYDCTYENHCHNMIFYIIAAWRSRWKLIPSVVITSAESHSVRTLSCTMSVSELLTCIFLCLADYWRPDRREGDDATEVWKGTGQPETADGGASERNHQHPGRKAGGSREAAQWGTWQRQKGCCWSISTDKTGKAASRFVLSLCVKFIQWLPQVCGRCNCELLIISLINLF